MPPGSVASTGNVLETESDSFCPAAVWGAVAGWLPSVNAVGASMVHRPPLLTTAVPIGVPSMLTVTVAPGSPVPDTVGAASLIVEPSAGVVMVGASGAVVSRSEERRVGKERVRTGSSRWAPYHLQNIKKTTT